MGLAPTPSSHPFHPHLSANPYHLPTHTIPAVPTFPNTPLITTHTPVLTMVLSQELYIASPHTQKHYVDICYVCNDLV